MKTILPDIEPRMTDTWHEANFAGVRWYICDSDGIPIRQTKHPKWNRRARRFSVYREYGREVLVSSTWGTYGHAGGAAC